MTLIPRQVYFGRVISPAKFYPASGNRKPFITFVLAVNGLASVREGNSYKRASAKITCSYTIQSDNDMVATILSRISSGDNSQELGGESYKSVYVGIEGTERLVQVTDSEGANKGYYKNLDFCSVEILDSHVRDLYRKEAAPEKNTKTPEEPTQPTLAPIAKKQQVIKQVAPPVEETIEESFDSAVDTTAPIEDGYSIGDVITDPTGDEFKYIGGDSAIMSSWEKLVKEEPVKKVPPFMKAKTPAPKQAAPVSVKPKTPTVEEVLADDGESLDSNLFAATQKGLAV